MIGNSYVSQRSMTVDSKAADIRLSPGDKHTQTIYSHAGQASCTEVCLKGLEKSTR